MSSKETKSLIMAVLKPRILFGSIVWFNERNENKVTKMLELLQNAANRLALGALKSSPIEQMTHDSNMISLKNLAIRYNHNFIYKRLTAPSSHPTRRILMEELALVPIRHQSPIHRLLRKTDLILPFDNLLETIHPYPDPPWVEPKWTIENMSEARDTVKIRIPKQIEDEQKKKSCVIFTDGSFIPEVGGGAAIATTEMTAAHAYGPTEGISNYEMEGMAIIIALVKFRQIIDTDPEKYSLLAIFSDSQAALGLFANPMQPNTLQYLARFLRKSHQRIPQELPISLYWTPGHEGIPLNEAADEAAKKAAEERIDVMILPRSLGGLLQHTRNVFNKRGAVTKTPFKTKSR